jgi:hypothetical protein
MARRYGLRDDQWARMEHLLPGRVGHAGGTARDNRLFLEAVLYRYRTGLLWAAPLTVSQQAVSERLRRLPAALFEGVLTNVLPDPLALVVPRGGRADPGGGGEHEPLRLPALRRAGGSLRAECEGLGGAGWRYTPGTDPRAALYSMRVSMGRGALGERGETGAMGCWRMWLVGLVGAAIILAGCGAGPPAPAASGQARPGGTAASTDVPMPAPIAGTRTAPRRAPTPPTVAPRVLATYPAPVGALAWSPDGARLATSSLAAAAPTIQLWGADAAPLATLAGHTAPVTSLAWSPVGTLLASGSADSTVRLWDAAGAARSVLTGAVGPVYALAWSPDGATLAVGASAGRTNPPRAAVRLYRADGTLVATLTTDIGTAGGKYFNLAWTRDGALLAAGALDYRVWHADGTPVARIAPPGPPAWGMGWSPDGRALALGNEDGDVLLYAPAGERLAAWYGVGSITSLGFAPDGRTLAVGSNTGVRLLRVAEPDTPPFVLGGTGANVAWSPDGRLGAAGLVGPLRVWRADGTALATLDGCRGAIAAIAWSPDGRALVAGSQDGAVCLWQP